MAHTNIIHEPHESRYRIKVYIYDLDFVCFVKDEQRATYVSKLDVLNTQYLFEDYAAIASVFEECWWWESLHKQSSHDAWLRMYCTILDQMTDAEFFTHLIMVKNI